MKNDIEEETNIKVLGNVLKDMGQYERALQCYEKVLKLVKPNDAYSHLTKFLNSKRRIFLLIRLSLD